MPLTGRKRMLQHGSLRLDSTPPGSIVYTAMNTAFKPESDTKAAASLQGEEYRDANTHRIHIHTSHFERVEALHGCCVVELSHLEAIVVADFFVQVLDLLDKVLGALLHDIGLDVGPQGLTPLLQQYALQLNQLAQ